MKCVRNFQKNVFWKGAGNKESPYGSTKGQILVIIIKTLESDFAKYSAVCLGFDQ